MHSIHNNTSVSMAIRESRPRSHSNPILSIATTDIYFYDFRRKRHGSVPTEANHSTRTCVTHAISETHAPSPKLPSQACHRGGRVAPRPVHAERHQQVSLTHTTRHDLRLLTPFRSVSPAATISNILPFRSALPVAPRRVVCQITTSLWQQACAPHGANPTLLATTVVCHHATDDHGMPFVWPSALLRNSVHRQCRSSVHRVTMQPISLSSSLNDTSSHQHLLFASPVPIAPGTPSVSMKSTENPLPQPCR